MRNIVAAALTLTALMPLHAVAASVTVKPGDTISDLADRYGVSVGSLLRINGISNSNHVEAGQTLQLPGGARGVVSTGRGRHTVQRGDTLGGIAARYQVSERNLIVINSLQSADHVEVGQTLKLPTTAVLPKPKPVAKAKPTPINANPNATSHTVASGQTLTQIARAYEIPVASLIDLNTINDPDKVTVGTKLMLRVINKNSEKELARDSATKAVSVKASTAFQSKPVRAQKQKPVSQRPAIQTTSTPRVKQSPKPVLTATATKPAKTVQAKPASWRTYGPLQVDWSNWQSMGGSMVAPTLNGDGKPLYVAVNCSARKINVTSSEGAWKSWIAPQTNFEKDLVTDRCKAA